jgi:hypothetical protein
MGDFGEQRGGGSDAGRDQTGPQGDKQMQQLMTDVKRGRMSKEIKSSV